MKRVLFIDRDGTLVVEPPVDKQVDSLEKLEFVPKVFQSLAYVATRLDFEWVMVTNQDGMGTSSFPAENFWTVQRKIIQAFANEGIRFDEVCIDSSFPEENLPTRKPGTAMLSRYQSGEYDLEHSEGLSSVCEAVTDDWWKIAEILCAGTRRVTIDRRTSETDICVTLNLDGTGRTEVHTGLGFFDHMLDQLGRHAGVDLSVFVTGDLQVDEHHTIEDTAIALGEAFARALGDKRGMGRWNATFHREKIGDMPTEMFYHFFKSFSDAARMNLNIQAEGTNEHHKIEGIFKALARALRMAVKRDITDRELPSTKGVL